MGQVAYQDAYLGVEEYHQPVESGDETGGINDEDLAILAPLWRKYRDIFRYENDSKNRPFLTLDNIDNGVIIVCPKGVISINDPVRNRAIVDGKVDLTSIFDCKISDKVDQERSVQVLVTLDDGSEILDTVHFLANNFEKAGWLYLRDLFDRTQEMEMLKREGKFDKIYSRDNAVSQIRGLAVGLAVEIA